MNVQKEITIKLTEVEYLMLKHFITRNEEDDNSFDSSTEHDRLANEFAIKFSELL